MHGYDALSCSTKYLTRDMVSVSSVRAVDAYSCLLFRSTRYVARNIEFPCRRERGSLNCHHFILLDNLNGVWCNSPVLNKVPSSNINASLRADMHLLIYV